MKTLNKLIGGAAVYAAAVLGGCSGSEGEPITVTSPAPTKRVLFTHELKDGTVMYRMLVPDTQNARMMLDNAANAHDQLRGAKEEDLAVEYMRMDALDGKFDSVAEEENIQKVSEGIYKRLEAQRNE